ncbi:restriction endonuclease subunit S [Furfurilactobacillus sp. WILCCON 0119]
MMNVRDSTEQIPRIRFKGFTDVWEKRKVSDLSNETYGGGTPKTNIKEYWNGNIPWIQSSNLTQDDVSIVKFDKFINERAIEESATKLIPKDSIAIVTRVGVGKLALIERQFTTSQDFLSLASLIGAPHFMLYLLYKKLNGRGQKGQGTSIKGITKSDLLNISVVLPLNTKEQDEIGSLFGNIDHLIAVNQREDDALQNLKKALLQKMFVSGDEAKPEIRFKDYTDVWEKRKLSSAIERVQGNDGRMNLPTLTISAGNGWMNQKDRFSGNIAGKEQKNYTLLKKGELSYNHGNSKLAKYGAVFELQEYQEALVPRVYHSFKVAKGGAAFVDYLFTTKLPDRELGKLVSSGARMDGLLNINYNDFSNITVNLPHSDEQIRIGVFFRKIDNLIAVNQRKGEVLKRAKKVLLQTMFV